MYMYYDYICTVTCSSASESSKGWAILCNIPFSAYRKYIRMYLFCWYINSVSGEVFVLSSSFLYYCLSLLGVDDTTRGTFCCVSRYAIMKVGISTPHLAFPPPLPNRSPHVTGLVIVPLTHPGSLLCMYVRSCSYTFCSYIFVWYIHVYTCIYNCNVYATVVATLWKILRCVTAIWKKTRE